MAVRGKKAEKSSDKTQMQMAKRERERLAAWEKQKAEMAQRQAEDIENVKAAAAKGWVEINEKDLHSHLIRCNNLKRNLFGSGTWYVIEYCESEKESQHVPMFVIEVGAWASWFLGLAREKISQGAEMVRLPAPCTEEESRSRYALWRAKCKAILTACHNAYQTNHERWTWNGGKSDRPWHVVEVLEIKLEQQALKPAA